MSGGDRALIVCVFVCLQDRVGGRENADQLVYLPPLQVSKGNLTTFHVFQLNVTASPAENDGLFWFWFCKTHNLRSLHRCF